MNTTMIDYHRGAYLHYFHEEGYAILFHFNIVLKSHYYLLYIATFKSTVSLLASFSFQSVITERFEFVSLLAICNGSTNWYAQLLSRFFLSMMHFIFIRH